MKRILLLAAATASSVVADGVINFAQLPACAKASCAVLSQADANCVPPAAPVTNQGVYQSCVCQSALLVGLKTSGSLCQTAGCSAQDATAISQYYNALCAGPVVQPQPGSTLTTTTTAATNTATAGAAAGQGLPVNRGPPSWISTHWKWVVMVAVIAVAMAVFWIGGIYVRRHYDRKRDAKLANMAAVDNSRGPAGPSGAPQMASLNSAVMGPSPGNQSRTGTPAPAAVLQRTRSRANTLQSLRRGDSSRTSVAQPVVWGPHQHQAAYDSSNNHSRSVTPVPAVVPSPVYRNADAMRSEPHRFAASPRPMSPLMNGGSSGQPNASHDTPTDSGWDSSPNLNQPDRPYARDVSRRTVSPMQTQSGLGAPPQGQTAEICETFAGRTDGS